VTKNPKKKRIIVNLAAISFLILGTAVAIKFAKGYRPDLQNKSLQGTGLLSLTSYPKSARVIINDKLTTVTDDKLYLAPGTYKVAIEKDGFHTWTKNLPIKEELVTSTDARLFPIITSISPLTFYQVKKTALNPDGTKIAYTLENAPQSTSNGLYIHSLTSNLLGSSNLQIAENILGRNYADSTLIWSPDSSQVLAVFIEKTKTSERITSAFLLSTKEKNSVNIADVTIRLPLIISEWQDQYAKLNLPSLSLFPEYIKTILTKDASNVFFSPDKEKVIYTPKSNQSLPANEIGSALPNINSTPDIRNLSKGQTYVFDLKEGTNYKLNLASNSAEVQKQLIVSSSATPSASIDSLKQLKSQTESYYVSNYTWYSNSRQIIVTNDNGINIVDYDGENLININPTLPLNNFAIPSSDGTKLVALTNLNQKPSIFNLFSFDLK